MLAPHCSYMSNTPHPPFNPAPEASVGPSGYVEGYSGAHSVRGRRGGAPVLGAQWRPGSTQQGRSLKEDGLTAGLAPAVSPFTAWSYLL
jgi:hypothetical protein